MVAEAEAQKGPSQLFARRVEQFFVPLVLVGSPTLTGILYFNGMPFADAALRGISVLVAASPCALAISTPAAVLSAVARAAKSGILFKGGAHLEMLGKVDTICFDKTGTLTEGKPHVVKIVTNDGVSENDLLTLAAAAESQSSHPLARAIVEEAGKRGLTVAAVRSAQAVHGKGLRAVLSTGESVGVGSLSLFDGTPVPANINRATLDLQEAGRTAAVVEADGKFLGVLGLADTPRADSKLALERLRKLGVTRFVMLSGDNQVTARAVAAEVGVKEVRAPLMPDGKVVAVRELAKEGKVAMVGDGVNDAPALASASVGVAMGGAGSDVALETADLVLMGDDLRNLPVAVELARKATRTIMQNLTIALGVSGLLVLASVFGWVNIASAVVFHEGSTLVVCFNGLRLLWFKPTVSVA
jgi:Cd2+/Zn2+-exporting ATPase